MKRIQTVLGACIVFAANMSAANLSLGQAANYQLFVLHNDTQTGSDVRGRVAIGGNYTGDTAFAAFVNDPAGVYSIVIGGALNLTGTTLSGGDLFAGTAATFTGTGLGVNIVSDGSVSLTNLTDSGSSIKYLTTYSANGVGFSGTLTHLGSAVASPVDFQAAATNLQTISTTLSATAATGAAVIDQYNHGITLTTTKTGINVFNLTAAQLSGTGSGLTVNNTFNDATVIINVSADGGGADTFVNTGFNLNGITASKVLYNFGQSTTQVTAASGIQGAILAPWANLTNPSGSGITSQVLVSSLSGAGEIESALFTGAFPNAPVATPEPSTGFLMLGTGIVSALAWRRRKTSTITSTN